MKAARSGEDEEFRNQTAGSARQRGLTCCAGTAETVRFRLRTINRAGARRRRYEARSQELDVMTLVQGDDGGAMI